MLQILGIVAPLALFSAALLMTVAIFARSFKEAQTYLTVLIFVPMIPAIVLMLNPVKPALWMMLIPTFGQNLLITDVMRGELPGWLPLTVASVASLVAAAGLLWVAAKLFERERIIFGI